MVDVVLTGATGFVGTQILRTLLDRGCTVRVPVRNPSQVRQKYLSREGLEIVETSDLFSEDAEGLEALLRGARTLIHAAWFATPGEYLNSAMNLACLTGTLNLARAFSLSGGKRFVGLGTCAEYYPSPGLITTATPLEPQNLYAACKMSAYQVLRHFCSSEAISFSWCRIFYLYGEGENGLRLVPYVRRQLEAGQAVMLTRGDQIRDFLDVAEAGRMIVDVALGDDQGAVNICSGKPTTVRQLVEGIADEYGRRDLLRFGAKAENCFDPPSIVGKP